MARPGEEKVYQAMKGAKNAQEMVNSWIEQRPGYERPSAASPLDFYIKRKPEMVFTYAHNQLTQVVERGILDPKTRYLVILAQLPQLGGYSCRKLLILFDPT